MKLWRCTFYDLSLGKCLSWHANNHDAEQRLRIEIAAAKKSGEMSCDMEISHVDMVDIPTKKPELIRWLNTYYDKDNG